MGKTSSNSQSNTLCYKAVKGGEDLAALETELAAWCEENAIEIDFKRREGRLLMHFNERADMLATRMHWFMSYESRRATHTQNFDRPNPQGVKAWGREVSRFLDAAGIDYAISYNLSEVRVVFHSEQAFVMFQELERTGFFDRMAKPLAVDKTDGPAI